MKEHPIIFNAEMIREIPAAFREWNESRRIILDDDLVQQLFEAGSTAKEIAFVMDCSTYPVKKALKRLGLKRPAKRRPGVGCGSNNSAWKGGRRIRPDGYVMIWTPSGEHLEHRVIMERHIGRRLTAEEIVHHRDENNQNNEIPNLELMTQSEHAKHHAPKMHAARYGS